MRERHRFVLSLLLLAISPASGFPISASLGAQAAASPDTMAFYRALDLEAAGKYRDAIPLFRAALKTPAAVNALLGLERAYAELGWSDSLVAPLDTLISANPKEETFRTVQLRTLQMAGRQADLRRAFDAWTHDMPSSAAPYREYARLLQQKNQSAAADVVLLPGRTPVGTTEELHDELATPRAERGQGNE